jgi:hypothetical protein
MESRTTTLVHALSQGPALPLFLMSPSLDLTSKEREIVELGVRQGCILALFGASPRAPALIGCVLSSLARSA